MDQYLDIAKEYYDKAVKAVSKTETEKKLANALSRHNWGASSTELREIARLTNDWQEYSVVMREIWSTMQLSGNRWRQIFKSLTLLEFLIKNGAERVIEEARDKITHIKTLTGFSFYSEGVEKGAGIREKAKQLVELLGNTEQIREERQKAQALRDKYTGMGRGGTRTEQSSYNGGSYDSGGYGGRYSKKDAYSDKPKSWDEGFSKSNNGADDDDDDDDFNPRGDPPKKAPEPVVDSGDDSDEDSGNKGRRKGKKGKLKIKIRSATSAKKQAAEDDEDLLFGDMQASAPKEEVDLFGESSAPQKTESQPFDPFSPGGGGNDDSEDWAGFESAKPAAPPAAPKEVDLFGSLSGAPASTQFQPFQAQANSQQQNDSFDLLGSPGTAQPVSGGLNMASMSQMSQPMNTMQNTNTMNLMQAKKPQQAQPQGNSADDMFSGLVDLGSLSLNNNKPPQAHAPKPQSTMGSTQPPMGMMQPTLQPMMQPSNGMMQPNGATIQPGNNLMQPNNNTINQASTSDDPLDAFF